MSKPVHHLISFDEEHQLLAELDVLLGRWENKGVCWADILRVLEDITEPHYLGCDMDHSEGGNRNG